MSITKSFNEEPEEEPDLVPSFRTTLFTGKLGSSFLEVKLKGA